MNAASVSVVQVSDEKEHAAVFGLKDEGKAAHPVGMAGRHIAEGPERREAQSAAVLHKGECVLLHTEQAKKRRDVRAIGRVFRENQLGDDVQHIKAVMAERTERAAVVAVQMRKGDGDIRHAGKRAAPQKIGKDAFAAVEQQQTAALAEIGRRVARLDVKKCRAAPQKMKLHEISLR